MFRHVLFWKVKDSVDGKSKAELIPIIAGLVLAVEDKIDVIRHIEVGTNLAHVENAFDMVVMLDFDTWDDLLTFVNHPEHKKLGASVAPYRESSIIVDYER